MNRPLLALGAAAGLTPPARHAALLGRTEVVGWLGGKQERKA
jgi:hypothetical protein